MVFDALLNKYEKKYFGTDGIRGTVNIGNINGEKFFKFGLTGTYFKNLREKQVAIIAKDTRLSGYTSSQLLYQVWHQLECIYLH